MTKVLQALGVLMVLLAASALADSWAPPSVQQYASTDGKWRLTVYPRPLASQLNYFKDKVNGNRNAGGVPGESQKTPIGHMEHRVDGHWVTAWKEPLVNDVAPVEALVSKEGEAATLDNWHGMGWGDDAIVIYAASGTMIRKVGLADFLPKYYVDALPRSVSSIHWRGDARVDEAKRQLVVPVVVPMLDAGAAFNGKARHIEARFRLSDGSLVPMDGEAWGPAVAAASEVNARHEQERAEQRARFISPLAAPTDGNVTSWHQYLREQSVWDAKPAAVISVSPGAIGAFGANHHLRQSLVFLNMPVMQQPEAYIGQAATLFADDGSIANDNTRAFFRKYLEAFAAWIEITAKRG